RFLGRSVCSFLPTQPLPRPRPPLPDRDPRQPRSQTTVAGEDRRPPGAPARSSLLAGGRLQLRRFRFRVWLLAVRFLRVFPSFRFQVPALLRSARTGCHGRKTWLMASTKVTSCSGCPAVPVPLVYTPEILASSQSG